MGGCPYAIPEFIGGIIAGAGIIAGGGTIPGVEGAARISSGPDAFFFAMQILVDVKWVATEAENDAHSQVPDCSKKRTPCSTTTSMQS